MNNRNVLKSILSEVKIELLSFTNNEIVISDLDGIRKIELPFTKQQLNDKYVLDLINYDNNSMLLELTTDKDNEKLQSISYKNDYDVDVMVVKMLDKDNIYELCVGKYNNGLEFVNMNKKTVVEGKKKEINLGYSNDSGNIKLTANDNGYTILDNEVKMWVVDKEEELMQIFTNISNLEPNITNLLIGKYRILCNFQNLFKKFKQDKSVIEYLSMKQDKGVQKNILGK